MFAQMQVMQEKLDSLQSKNNEEIIMKGENDERESAKLMAVEWLEDFLIRLHDQPAVIHCIEDGEIFCLK